MTSNKRYPLGPYGLGLVLAALFVVSWVCYGITRYTVDHRYTTEDDAPWWLHWLDGTFENITSEWAQLGGMVVLGAIFAYHGATEGREAKDEHDRQYNDLASRLEYLTEKVSQLERKE